MPPDQQNSVDLAAIAQTNLAFYKQLHAARYDQAALIRMRDSYEFATTLFAGRLRATGKPFLAHLVGTASILASLGATPEIVTAGLLHATYEQGEWGFTRWHNRRSRLRQAIGDEAESLVWRYQEMVWTSTVIQRVHNDFAILKEIDRAVVLIRLANELDDQLDLAMRYVDPAKDEHRVLRPIFIALAKALQKPQLAAALTESYRDTDEAEWASALSLGRKASYRLNAPLTMKVLKKIRTRMAALRTRSGGHFLR